MSTVNSLCQGMERLKDELDLVRQSSSDASDLFVTKMQPFVRKMEPAVQALQSSGKALESELRALLSYFGESLEGSDATKPEDFFNLVLSFSRALQVSVICVD
jgi:diaphanous 1